MKTTIKYWETTVKGVCGQRDLRKTKLNNEKTSDYDNVNSRFSHILKKSQNLYIKVLTSSTSECDWISVFKEAIMLKWSLRVGPSPI